VPHETHPLHRRLAEIGLRAGGPFGFALAGGHAVAAHGILDRPSEDVDLFSDWQRRADFPKAVDAVIAAYENEGFQVAVDLRVDTFARLHVSQDSAPDEQHRVELVANWRGQPPVEMQIGPVLHPDDVMAGKMDALYNRAAARDFLDIDAASPGAGTRLTSSAHSRPRPMPGSTGNCSPRCLAPSPGSTIRTSSTTASNPVTWLRCGTDFEAGRNNFKPHNAEAPQRRIS